MERDGQIAKVLFYVSKIMYPKYNPFWFVFYMYLSYFNVMKRKVTYILLPKPNKYILDCVSAEPINFSDVNNTVVVYEQNLYKTDRILRLFCSKRKKYRIVRVVPSPLCQRDLIICSETCHDNLKNCGFDTSSLKLLSFREHLVGFAEEIDVSLINCPYDISNAVVDGVLENYFKTPKLLNKGDIFEIDVKYFARELFYLNNKINQVKSVYFKCNRLLFRNLEVEGSYFCVIGETAIKQSANIQSFVPLKSSRAINKQNHGFGEVPLCPYGLQSYLENIKRAVMPFLRKSEYVIE